MSIPPDERPYDVIAAGGVPVDIVLKVDSLPTHGNKLPAEYVGKLPGGPAPNFACVVARLGYKSASLASVAPDSDGQLILDDFKKNGVSTEFVAVREGTVTSFTVILIEPSGERSILLPGITQSLDQDLAQEAIKKSRFFYMMPYDYEFYLELAPYAWANQTRTMCDLEPDTLPDSDTFEQVLAGTDIASFNQQGFQRYIGEAPTFDNMRALLALGPEIIVVTRAENGAMAATADATAEVSGIQMEAADTTGAGDTFNAAFLVGTLEDKPLKDRLAFANAAAAISVTGLGPRGHLPTYDEVETLLTAG